VSDERDTQNTPERPAGIFSCLTMGFEITARRPQLILIPALLDLYLWLGPRLSLSSLIAQMRTLWGNAPSIELAPVYQLMNEIFDLFASRYNLFSLLNFSPLLGVPALMGARMTLERPFGIRPDIPVTTSGIALGWSCVLLIIGLGLNAWYLWQIGLRVSQDLEVPVPGPMTPGKLWGRLVQLVIGLLSLGFLLSLPLSFAISLLGMLSLSLGGIALTLILCIAFFIFLHVIYVVPGMVQLCQPPLQAIRESVALTRIDFMGTSGMVMIMFIITQGLNFVWVLPDPASWATLVGIGGHALIGTALTVTLFVFYQERLAYLRMLRHTYAANTAHSPADT